MKNDNISGSTYLAIKALNELLTFNKSKRPIIFMKTLKQMKGMYIFENIYKILENNNYSDKCIEALKYDIINEQKRIIQKAKIIISNYSSIMTISNSSVVYNTIKDIEKNIFILKSSPENEGIVFYKHLEYSKNKLYLIEDNEFENYYNSDCIFLSGCDGYFDNKFINKRGTKRIIEYAEKHNRDFIVLCDKYKRINNTKRISIPDIFEIITLNSCKNLNL